MPPESEYDAFACKLRVEPVSKASSSEIPVESPRFDPSFVLAGWLHSRQRFTSLHDGVPLTYRTAYADEHSKAEANSLQPRETMVRPISVAILTVSDTCARDATQDKSGPRLAELFSRDESSWRVVETSICADVVEDIQRIVRRWTDEVGVGVVLTSGGTGFAKRDVTPEAIKPLLDKEAPGLVHAMFRRSFEITPLAAMARLVAGVRKDSMIVTVPGSPKGAVENAEAIIKLLPHASELASDAVNSRQVHAQGAKSIEEAAGLAPAAPSPQAGAMAGATSQHACGGQHDHSHGHRHKTQVSNDPSLSVTKRARESPYKMISVTDALNLVLKNTPLAQTTELPIYGLDSDYRVEGHVVSEDLYAKESVPAYRASIVDGYAVIASDGPGSYPVVSVSHASPGSVSELKPGQITRITTGAPLPMGADSVVMVEYTKLVESTDDGKEERKVEILVSTTSGDNIREPGSDLECGTLVMARGERISATGGEMGILASAGFSSIPVFQKPVVGVLSTGDELVDPSSQRALASGEIRDSNRVSLLSTLTSHGYHPLDLGIARDSGASLQSTLTSAMTRCDVIITTGGVSMGELDLLKPTIERSLGGTIHFGRVAMKPGKPTTFATIPRLSNDALPPHAPDATTETSITPPTGETQSGRRAPPRPQGDVLVFALPGNPASALVTYHLFVLPALRKLSGHQDPWSNGAGSGGGGEEGDGEEGPRIKVVLAHDVALDPRPEFHRVVVRVSPLDGRLLATSTGGQRSSRVGSLRCNAFLCLPAKMGDEETLCAGTLVDAIPVDTIGPAT